MEKGKVALIAVIAAMLIGIVGISMCIDMKGNDPTIDSFHAVETVMNDYNVSEYYSSHFKVEEWRITTTSLVGSAPNSTDHEEGVWKVEIMERSCACSGINKLYVIEGYVSASTGELLDVSTKSVLESEYDKKTCSSLSCH
ncbi:hypothetical protein [Methanolobus sp. WCC5]|uniref:hypothetical protein n=1 Tax=Methanolobus sp. WCC5 TaxID=3125785 RepID=UPI003252154A